MLPFILIATTKLPPRHLPSSLLVTPGIEQKFAHPQSKQQIQQLQERLNRDQKHYEWNIKQFQTLPHSRIDCYPEFPPISGVDPISCSLP